MDPFIFHLCLFFVLLCGIHLNPIPVKSCINYLITFVLTNINSGDRILCLSCPASKIIVRYWETQHNSLCSKIVWTLFKCLSWYDGKNNFLKAYGRLCVSSIMGWLNEYIHSRRILFFCGFITNSVSKP